MLTLHGKPVATRQRYTFTAQLSLVDRTLPKCQGAGSGAHQRVLADDSIAAGVDLVYLGVYATTREHSL